MRSGGCAREKQWLWRAGSVRVNVDERGMVVSVHDETNMYRSMTYYMCENTLWQAAEHIAGAVVEALEKRLGEELAAEYMKRSGPEVRWAGLSVESRVRTCGVVVDWVVDLIAVRCACEVLRSFVLWRGVGE